MKKIVVALYCLVTLGLICTTLFASQLGLEWVQSFCYASSWFFALWFVFGLWFCIYIFARRLWKKTVAMLLHVALLLILIGGGITWLWGEKGQVYVRSNSQEIFLKDANNQIQSLPFSLCLKRAIVTHSEYSSVPNDYKCEVIIEQKNGESQLYAISMNHVVSCEGYRFCLSSIDGDEQGVTLMINHDPFGIAFTYVGYVLFVLSMIILLLSRYSQFRILVVQLLSRCVSTSQSSTSWNNRVEKTLLYIVSSVFAILYVLYWLQCGHVPMTNIVETMMSLSLCILLNACALRNIYRRIIPISLSLSVCLLLIVWGNRQSAVGTDIAPILSTSLLGFHVGFIIVAYALFLIVTILACISTVLLLKREKNEEIVDTLTFMNRVLLYPAIFFLGIGICIGAVWANQAWGTYWSWDPKETWALITFLLYAATFHTVTIERMKNKLFFNVYVIVAFLSVLMTYLGVNAFFGGMHTY